MQLFAAMAAMASTRPIASAVVRTMAWQNGSMDTDVQLVGREPRPSLPLDWHSCAQCPQCCSPPLRTYVVSDQLPQVQYLAWPRAKPLQLPPALPGQKGML